MKKPSRAWRQARADTVQEQAMKRILPRPKKQLQVVVTNPPVAEIEVFENAIHNLARAGNREAVKKALQVYLELWRNKAERQVA